MNQVGKLDTLPAAVGDILWREWDPIGVNAFAQARDEYDGYVPQLCELLREGAGEAAVFRRLLAIEANMGLDPDEAAARRIAQHLVELARSA
jgi:hypothetical protein